jgi:hypothetical protein
LICFVGRWLAGRRRSDDSSQCCVSATRPDQHFALLVYRDLLGIDQVFPKCFQGVVIEPQSEFEDAIGEAFFCRRSARAWVRTAS